MIDQGVARNTRLAMIRLGESSIDDHQFAIGFDGVLTFGGMDGNVAVDDVAVGACHTECIKDAVAYFFGVAQLEIVAFLLFIGLAVSKEITLKRSHL